MGLKTIAKLSEFLNKKNNLSNNEATTLTSFHNQFNRMVTSYEVNNIEINWNILVEVIWRINRETEVENEESFKLRVEKIYFFLEHQDQDYLFQVHSILSNGYKKISYNGYNLKKMDIFQQLVKLGLVEVTEINPPPYSGMKYITKLFKKDLFEF